ncbi:MAG: beta-glucosidase [Elusimicrobia bacterium RIFOXYB2_FULL_49_7]|nr:MAG: beta-glucosidase [Elusimicrobia bacterium RIFOXYB2_FULL_49_7]
MTFPNGFIWGAAAASYQIEGAASEDGRGETIWDRFAHTPGKVKNGHTGDIACDHYHRYKEDVAIMKQIGLSAYRLSMAWSRLFPSGRGSLNRKGVDFYNKLVDTLLENGITPYITLFHWDLPQALQEQGGFGSRDIAYYFRDYAAEAVRHLGDRVKHWMTLNEPGIYVSNAHMLGVHAPGIRDLKTAMSVSHTLLLGHGEAVAAMRKERADLKIGIALSASMRDPATAKSEDIEAAARCFDFEDRWYFDALYRGQYPERILREYAAFLPDIREGDMQIIRAPMNWLGINNYSRAVVAHDETERFLKAKGTKPAGASFTDFNWEIYPEGIYRILKWASEEFDYPDIYITENGAAFNEGPDASGRVPDERRIRFLQAYLQAAGRAITEGVKLKGYFLWSIMDNFEWAEGFGQRFGIVHVDYATQKRTLKDSAYWYGKLIRSNSVPE